MAELHNPHDHFFKAVFGRTPVANDFLQPHMIKFLRKAIKKLWPKPKTLRERYPQYRIGKGTYDCGDLSVYSWGEGAELSIGAYCSIAKGVQIFLGGEHRTDWVTTYPFNVKKRFDDHTVERLQSVKWWEWSEERIEKALPLLMNPEVERFLLAVENQEF